MIEELATPGFLVLVIARAIVLKSELSAARLIGYLLGSVPSASSVGPAS